MGRSSPFSIKGSLGVCISWCAACLSLSLAASAFAMPTVYRIAIVLTGVVSAVVILPLYLRYATPVTAVAVTASAALLTTLVATSVSGFAWASGKSWSTTGVEGSPSAWLFTGMSWCLAIGLLSTGLILAREGYRSGHLGKRGYTIMVFMSTVSFLGFTVVGTFPVGSTPFISVIHNIAGVAAMGPFWIGMVASIRTLPKLSDRLRTYSAVAAVLVQLAWLPTAFRFIGLTDGSFVSTLRMELVVVPLCFVWVAWLAYDWSSTDAPEDT